ncbi:PAS domain S-box protein [Dankookia sp. P2]|uniref:PAS domain-containing protein n=1 Tax=Dankookia sp. P2 TaxID=3423955 RepID=UPI003D67110F
MTGGETRPDAGDRERLLALEAEVVRLRAALTAAGLDASVARAATADAEAAMHLARSDAATAASGHACDMAAGRIELTDAAAFNVRLQDLNDELLAREERLQAVVESATSHAIIEMDFEGRITGWSPGAEHVLGWTAAEAIGQDGAVIWTLEDRAAGEPERERQVADAVGTMAGDRWHVRCDGARFWGSGHLTLLRNGRPRGYLKILRDRTAERRAEEALRESEAARRVALEGGRMGAWRWDCRARSVRCDPMLMALWGLPSTEAAVPVEVFTALTSHEGAGVIEAVMAQEVAPGEEFDWDLEVISGPTTGHWIRLRGRADLEQPWIIHGVSFDVTDTRAAAARLRESEARHRLLIESWTQAVWETDADGVVVADSPSWRAYTGQTPEEWRGFGWLDAIHPDDRPHAERHWREAIAARGPVDAEYRLRAPNGGWRWTNVRAAPVPDAKGHVEKWVGMNIDIDARKRAEASLQESKDRYHALFSSMDEAYAVIEVLRDKTGAWGDFRFLEVNPAFVAHTSMPYPVGKTATELLGAPNPRWTQMYGQALDTGDPMRVQEAEPTLGRLFDLNIFSLDRAQNRVAVLFSDITARVKADLALRESEARFRSLVEGIPQLLWRSAEGGVWRWASSRWSDYTGQSPEAALELGWLDAVHPEDRAATRSAWAEAPARGLLSVDHRLRRAADGAWRWHQTRALPVEDGVQSEWLGSCTDIEDQMQARTVLARGQHELQELVAQRTGELMAAEATLRQSQKMEAIGQLTGGIAHDFNNMLQGVIGGLHMVRLRLAEGRTADVARYTDAACDAAGRAAGLTRRLLAFARRQKLEPRPIDTDALIRGMEDLVRRSVGPAIALKFRLHNGSLPVLCDPSELESAVLNLCINARDAMASGGS